MMQVAAVVTQPARVHRRGSKVYPTPVAVLAEQRGMPAERILAPEKARDVRPHAAAHVLTPCIRHHTAGLVLLV